MAAASALRALPVVRVNQAQIDNIFVRGRAPQKLKQYNEKKRVARFYNCPTCSTPHLPRERATTLATMGRKRTKERHTGTRMRDKDQGHKFEFGGLRLRALASANVELSVGAERLQPLPLRPCGRIVLQT